MKPLRPLCLSLGLLLCTHALAHDPLPSDWGTQPRGMLAEIGVFEIDLPELQVALAEEEALAAQCAEHGTSSARAASAGAPGDDAYWRYPQPLDSCGVVLHLDWNAATRLARRRCAEISAGLGLWPPAIPFVNSPTSYNDQNAQHHDVYRITHGVLTGACVSEVAAGPIMAP